MKIIELEEVDSTNEFLKRESFCTDCAVIAKRQTAGRGTKGRSFSSESGGAYVSVLRLYKDFPAENAFKIMVCSCVAVCETLKKFGVKPVIRWANDVLAEGKKICGTLIENTFLNGKISRSVVGIGINVNNDFPVELKDVAVSMRQILGRNIDEGEVAEELIKNLDLDYGISDYKKYIDWFGRGVTLKESGGEKRVVALDVAEDGRLIVEDGGKLRKISSAEVSLRL